MIDATPPPRLGTVAADTCTLPPTTPLPVRHAPGVRVEACGRFSRCACRPHRVDTRLTALSCGFVGTSGFCWRRLLRCFTFCPSVADVVCLLTCRCIAARVKLAACSCVFCVDMGILRTSSRSVPVTCVSTGTVPWNPDARRWTLPHSTPPLPPHLLVPHCWACPVAPAAAASIPACPVGSRTTTSQRGLARFHGSCTLCLVHTRKKDSQALNKIMNRVGNRQPWQPNRSDKQGRASGRLGMKRRAPHEKKNPDLEAAAA